PSFPGPSTNFPPPPASRRGGRVWLALRQSHVISWGWGGSDAPTWADVLATSPPSRSRSRGDRTRTAALRRTILSGGAGDGLVLRDPRVIAVELGEVVAELDPRDARVGEDVQRGRAIDGPVGAGERHVHLAGGEPRPEEERGAARRAE